MALSPMEDTLARLEQKRFSGAVEVSAPEKGATARVYMTDGAIYAASLDGYMLDVLARLRADAWISDSEHENAFKMVRGVSVDPNIGPYAVEKRWLTVEQLADIHREVVLAIAASVLSWTAPKVRVRKRVVTSIGCTVALTVAAVTDQARGRATVLSRYSGSSSVAIDMAVARRERIPEYLLWAAPVGETVDGLAERVGRTRFEVLYDLLTLTAAESRAVTTTFTTSELPHQPRATLLVPEHVGVWQRASEAVTQVDLAIFDSVDSGHGWLPATPEPGSDPALVGLSDESVSESASRLLAELDPGMFTSTVDLTRPLWAGIADAVPDTDTSSDADENDAGQRALPTPGLDRLASEESPAAVSVSPPSFTASPPPPVSSGRQLLSLLAGLDDLAPGQVFTPAPKDSVPSPATPRASTGGRFVAPPAAAHGSDNEPGALAVEVERQVLNAMWQSLPPVPPGPDHELRQTIRRRVHEQFVEALADATTRADAR